MSIIYVINLFVNLFLFNNSLLIQWIKATGSQTKTYPLVFNTLPICYLTGFTGVESYSGTPSIWAYDEKLDKITMKYTAGFRSGWIFAIGT